MFAGFFVQGIQFYILWYIFSNFPIFPRVLPLEVTQHEIKGMTGQTLVLNCPSSRKGQQQQEVNWFKGKCRRHVFCTTWLYFSNFSTFRQHIQQHLCFWTTCALNVWCPFQWFSHGFSLLFFLSIFLFVEQNRINCPSTKDKRFTQMEVLFWEMFRKLPMTVSTLVVLQGNKKRHPLRPKSWFWVSELKRLPQSFCRFFRRVSSSSSFLLFLLVPLPLQSSCFFRPLQSFFFSRQTLGSGMTLKRFSLFFYPFLSCFLNPLVMMSTRDCLSGKISCSIDRPLRVSQKHSTGDASSSLVFNHAGRSSLYFFVDEGWQTFRSLSSESRSSIRWLFHGSDLFKGYSQT